MGHQVVQNRVFTREVRSTSLGLRFSSEGRVVHLERKTRRDDTNISWDSVSTFDLHKITYNYLFSVDDLFLSITYNQGFLRDSKTWMEYAKKQRSAPIHSSVWNPPNSCLQNLTHSGVVTGGVKAFGPSRAKISFARKMVKPCHKL